MRLRPYTVKGPQAFWVRGAKFEPGDEVRLPSHEHHELVRIAVDAGVIGPRAKDPDADERMTCPICAEHMKRPTRVESADELAAHYADRHGGFVVPDFVPDTEDDS